MNITSSQLSYCGVSSKLASVYAPLISKYSNEFGINTSMRMAHFLAQILHESACFKFTKELASGSAYENRKDLGNTSPGDGVRYKGRGLIQVTGKANYQTCSNFFGVDFIKQPELLEQPEWAVRSAMWFWMTHNLNQKADRDELTNITKVINGGTNGLSNRLSCLGKAKRALGLIKK